MDEVVERIAHHISAMADHDAREAEARRTGRPMRPSRGWDPSNARPYLRQAAYVLQFLQTPTPEMIEAAEALGDGANAAEIWAAMIGQAYEGAWDIADRLPDLPAEEPAPQA